MKKLKLVPVALVMLLVISSLGLAQGKGYPVDIPGTNVNFFLMRYEGDQPPYERINDIWERLNTVLLNWVDQGQHPQDLTAADVSVGKTAEGEIGVFLKDQLIVVVDEYHARINRATPAQLGEMWANNLRKGVSEFVRINVLRSR